MAHYDCRYCGESKGAFCCPASKLEHEFDLIKSNVYHRAKVEAEDFYATLIKKKYQDLHTKYRWHILSEIYLRVLKGKIKVKGEYTPYNMYRISGFVNGQGREVNLVEMSF